jgi:hypothetical protein
VKNFTELYGDLHYVESIAVKADKYSQHILEALELPDFGSDFCLDSDADQETNDKAVV